jgi:L-ascorbate metabolism protein UlaG (beta-lactamase superfamily)
MECTYYGHSTFLVKTENHSLLFDPFIAQNPLASHIDSDAINPDYILISHAHGDHCADVERVAKHTGATIIANFEIVNHFSAKGIEGFAMNSGGSHEFPFGKVTMTHAYHSSSFPDGSYGGNPNGFIIQSEDRSIFYSGDTSLTSDFILLGERYNIDLAILPIGNVFTMDYIDAERACRMLKAKKLMGVHFDTFPPIKIDHDTVHAYMNMKGQDFILPTIGETLSL